MKNGRVARNSGERTSCIVEATGEVKTHVFAIVESTVVPPRNAVIRRQLAASLSVVEIEKVSDGVCPLRIR